MKRKKITNAARELIGLALLLCATSKAEALKNPIHPQCEVEAKVLSISNGKFYWNKSEFYRYFDIGILVTNVKSQTKTSSLLACSSLAEKTRTDIVRWWDFNNIGEVQIYENKKTIQPSDKLTLELGSSYVGDGAWPTILRIKLNPEDKPGQTHK
ncbi:MAG: hypothetical protein SFW62_07480 [Alphaproteobacteria bacterium]|nr:hypothetical protein [Alphaproteobacteria bacterium]